ncbi:MAG: DUF6712 family protein [Lutibacter sp.]|jgi:hypothetical protein
MITKNIEDIRKYATVSSSFTFPKLENHLLRVSENEISETISEEEYARLEAYADSDLVVLKAIKIIKDAETNLALFNYLQVGDIQINSGGVSKIIPQGQDAAPDKDVRDAMRYHKKCGLKALDKLLTLFEENEAEFALWKASKQYTKFKNLLVNSTADFQAHYNIFESRQTFLSLVSEIETVEYEFIMPSITNASLTHLKTTESADPIFINVKKLLEKAIVFFTVSKTLGSGLYYQSATGFELRFDVLDYERKFGSEKEISSHIKAQKKQKETEAIQFLKMAVGLIRANPLLFAYVAPTVVERNPFIAGKSIVGL